MESKSWSRRFFLSGTPPVENIPTSGSPQTTEPLGCNFMRGRKTVQISEKDSGTLTVSGIKMLARGRRDMPFQQVGATITAAGFYGFDEEVEAVKLEVSGHSAGVLVASLSGWNEEHG